MPEKNADNSREPMIMIREESKVIVDYPFFAVQNVSDIFF
jgi:hypothetical protein